MNDFPYTARCRFPKCDWATGPDQRDYVNLAVEKHMTEAIHGIVTITRAEAPQQHPSTGLVGVPDDGLELA